MQKSSPPTSDAFPEWNKDDPDGSIKQIYDWTIQQAEENVEWYNQKKRRIKKASRFIRGFSIVFGALGTLCPLVDALDIAKDIPFGQWGYIFFALAAAMILFDRFFGLSTGWMRFISAHLAVKKLLDEFRYSWIIALNCQYPEPAAGDAQQQTETSAPRPKSRTETLLELLKNFYSQVDDEVIKETNSWITEFKSSLSEMSKYVDSRGKSSSQASSTGQGQSTTQSGSSCQGSSGY
jgi:hypothetical protein